MTAANFARCLPLTLGYEGGWSNDPRDPGKATMCGITQQVYDEYRDGLGLPRQSVRLSTYDERAAIYRARYWDKAACNELATGVDYAVFDFAVNSGVARAGAELQRVVGLTGPAVDGWIGPKTLAAAKAYTAAHGLIALTDAICAARMSFLRGLCTFPVFGTGWTRRVIGAQPGHQAGDTGVVDRAFDMARGDDPLEPTVQIITPKTYAGYA